MEKDFQARAKLIQTMVDQARSESAFANIGRLMLPVVEVYEPEADMLWFAPTAVRILAYNGAYDAARTWYTLARAEENKGSPAGTAASVAMWPIIVLMPEKEKPVEEQPAPVTEEEKPLTLVDGDSGSMPVTPAAIQTSNLEELKEAPDYPLPYHYIDRWQTSLGQLPEAQQAQVQGTVISLFEALGHGVPMAALDKLAGLKEQPVKASPPIAGWRAYLTAMDHKKQAEAVALALIALGDEGPLRANGMFGASLVNGFTVLNLDKDARALAVELAIGAGA